MLQCFAWRFDPRRLYVYRRNTFETRAGLRTDALVKFSLRSRLLRPKLRLYPQPHHGPELREWRLLRTKTWEGSASISQSTGTQFVEGILLR